MKNHYAILGVTVNASADEIKVAYRLNAKRYHPDLNPGNENYKRRFLEIKEAYEILGNVELRKTYNEELAVCRKAQQARQTQQTGQTQQARPARQPEQTRQAGQMQQNGAHTYNRQSAQPPPRPETGSTGIQYRSSAALEEMKKIHELQLEIVKVSAKEQIVKHKKQAQEQIKAFKKQAAIEVDKAKKQYLSACEKAAKKAELYKKEYKKSSFNAGYKKGMKETKQSAQKTVAELKKLIELSAPAEDNLKHKESYNKNIQKIRLELSLANDKIRELEQQLGLLESQKNDAEKFETKKTAELTRWLEESEEKIGALTKTQENLKMLLQERAEEIDTLNEELAHLEGFIEIWKEIGSDNQITDAEREIIGQYEGTQREQAKDTLYGILGLFLNALPEEIEEAYGRLRKRYADKDKYIDRYIGVIEAYNILSDPEQKSAYDKSINNETEL